MAARFLGSLCFALATGVLSTSRSASAEPAHELTINRDVSTAYTLAATSAWLGIELSRPLWGPEACRWCKPPALDLTIRDALKADETLGANIASYGTAALTPVVALGGLGIAGARHGGGMFWTDTVIVGEAVATTMLVTNAFKMAFARERPRVHARTPEQKLAEAGSDDNLSFISGHASLAFAAATASGTVAELRGYDLAPWIWGAGLGFAGITGYLRIVADAHYFTDVIGGALVGSALGIGMPLLLHSRKTAERSVGVTPMPLGGVQGVMLSGVF